MHRQDLFLLLIILTAVLNAPAQSDLPPKGWKWVQPCAASFLVPSKLELQKSEARPIDSCWGTYGDGKIVVSVNEDPYAPSFERQSDWQAFTESPITVGPLTGKLVTFKMVESGGKHEKATNVTTLRLGLVRDDSASFALVIRTDPSVDPETVNKIRESVRFNQTNK